MTVSKRLRYEILRRDNHTCRYCGGAAPDVALTVDHVVPVALGGGDGASNLVTACRDCNAGKTSSSPDASLVDDVAQDALRWGNAMERAAELHRSATAELESYKRWIKNSWESEYVGHPVVEHEPDREWHFPNDPDTFYEWAVYDGYGFGEQKPMHVAKTEDAAVKWVEERRRRIPPMPRDWDASAHIWKSSGIDFDDIDECVEIAANASHVDRQSRYRYFCGVVWRRIEQRQEIARSLIEQEGE